MATYEIQYRVGVVKGPEQVDCDRYLESPKGWWVFVTPDGDAVLHLPMEHVAIIRKTA